MFLTTNFLVDTRTDIVFSSFEIQVKYLKSYISWTLVQGKIISTQYSELTQFKNALIFPSFPKFFQSPLISKYINFLRNTL